MALSNKYGSKQDKNEHALWHNPDGLYVTLLLGISPEEGFFVGVDPVLHSPTKHFISTELKDQDAGTIHRDGWAWWERRKRRADEPVEVLVGGKRHNLLRDILFVREAIGEDQGQRALVADHMESAALENQGGGEGFTLPDRVHSLASEFGLTEREVLDPISESRRTKMAVRGAVAELHLQRLLSQVNGVEECRRLDAESAGDVELRFRGSGLLTAECKNALRSRNREGLALLDFQRTRASKADPCSRFYTPEDLDLVAACLNSVTEHWDYRFATPRDLDPHKSCEGYIYPRTPINGRWVEDPEPALDRATRGASS